MLHDVAQDTIIHAAWISAPCHFLPQAKLYLQKPLLLLMIPVDSRNLAAQPVLVVATLGIFMSSPASDIFGSI